MQFQIIEPDFDVRDISTFKGKCIEKGQGYFGADKHLLSWESHRDRAKEGLKLVRNAA